MATYFFDLDGTLADSRPGLFSGFRAGLRAIGATSLDEATLHGFLGTPLPQIFAAVRPDVSAEETQAGIAAFRRAYEADGIFQNVLYPGVKQMLAQLQDRGHQAWIVTSKPQPHAVRVAELLGLMSDISGVVGAGLDELDTKTDLVARALAGSGSRPGSTFMLGDRSYDVIGARENGVAPVGALWGYGTREELAEAGCRRFAASAADFSARFISVKGLVGAF